MKLEPIVTQKDGPVTTSPQSPASIESIAYRPKGRRHPEQWKAKVNGRYVDVTPASARMIIDLARDFTDYKSAGLRRGGEPNDGGRKWWHYDFTPNDFYRYLVEAQQ